MGGDAAQPPDPGWEAPDEPRPRSNPARVDTSARGLAATLKALRREADRAVDAADAHKPRQAPDLTRAERLLVGKGEVFEDIALGAAVTAEATVGLVRRHAHTPRETSLGTWAFGRRMRTVSWATSMKFLAAAAAVVVMLMLAGSLAGEHPQVQQPQAAAATAAGPSLAPPPPLAPLAAPRSAADGGDIMGELRTKMRSRIAADTEEPTSSAAAAAAAVRSSLAPEAPGPASVEAEGSWEDEEADEIARGMAAWRKVQARRRLQALRAPSETEGMFSMFLLATAVSSLAFFVFDFVSWDCS